MWTIEIEIRLFMERSYGNPAWMQRTRCSAFHYSTPTGEYMTAGTPALQGARRAPRADACMDLCKASSVSSVIDQGLPHPKIRCPESLGSTALALTTLFLWFIVGSSAIAYRVGARLNSVGCLTFCSSIGMLVVLMRKWWESWSSISNLLQDTQGVGLVLFFGVFLSCWGFFCLVPPPL